MTSGREIVILNLIEIESQCQRPVVAALESRNVIMTEHPAIRERCFELAQEGRIEEAVALAEQATRHCPDSGNSWVALGRVRYRQRDLLGACHALETASLLIPLDPPTRSILAECFARTGHRELARHMYEALAGDARTPDRMLPAVAAGLGYLGEWGAALGVCLELARRAPALPEAHFGVAYYLSKLGRAPESILPIVARAHELAPDVPLYRISLATLLDHVGRCDEARDLLHGLDLDAVSCRCCVQRMKTIFFAPDPPHAGPELPERPEPL